MMTNVLYKFVSFEGVGQGKTAICVVTVRIWEDELMPVIILELTLSQIPLCSLNENPKCTR